ncbi:acetyltransferase [Providencia hangzhouensis]
MNNSHLKPVIIIGGGGHASILVDILISQHRNIIGVVCPDDISARGAFSGLRHFLSDDEVLAFLPQDIELVNGIGSMPGSALRQKVAEGFRQQGYSFATVIANSSTVSSFAELDQGVQVLHSAIIQAGVRIAEDVIVNTSSIVEHDSIIGKLSHIAPGSVLCGGVELGESVHIGCNASVIQNIKIGANSVVGAGATLTCDLGCNKTVFPGKIFIR